MRSQCWRISGPCAYFSVGMWPVSSSSGMYTNEAVSHIAPGYRFQYQVPPKPPPFSTMRTSPIPASVSRAAVSSPANPPPMTATVTWSVFGSRSARGVCGSSANCANRPVRRWYWLLPSARSRLSRSDAYLRRRASLSMTVPSGLAGPSVTVTRARSGE